MANEDPIRYAWERCNPRVPFPAVLTRTATEFLTAFYPGVARSIGKTAVVGAALVKFIHAPSLDNGSERHPGSHGTEP